LNSGEPHGFQEFLRTTPANAAESYHPSLLWDYLRANLEPSILASPDGHRWSLAVDAVERCEARGGDLHHLQLLKTIALIDLFKERSGLVPTPEVLGHALPGVVVAQIDAILDDLRAWSVVIFKRFLGAYAIYGGSDFDIDAAVEQAYARLTGIDFARLRSLAMLQPILAKRHYHRTGALRWFDIDMAPLSDGADYVRRYRPQNGATGLFLLLIATEAESSTKAHKLWEQAAGAAAGMPIAVGWSQDSYTIRELARELLALETVRGERAELNGDPVARREVNARIAQVAAELEERLRQAFLSAEWAASFDSTQKNVFTMPLDAGFPGLNAGASTLADARYPLSPRLHNELLNRMRPSSNAIAAQKALLKAMAEGIGLHRLGIAGYPAHGGLYASLLERTGLYRATPDVGGYRFTEPPTDDPAHLRPLWQAAEEFFKAAGTTGASLKSLFDLWQARPYGLRDGLFPILAIAFVLSRADRLAVYLDGVFQPRLTSLLTDRLTQDLACVRVRWSTISDFHRCILSGVADAIAAHGGLPAGQSFAEPLDIARGLVAVIINLEQWTLKTAHLSPTAIKVRNLAKLASDPNKFLLDDIPTFFTVLPADGTSQNSADAALIIAAVRTGLDELVAAYPRMLGQLAATMLTELRIPHGTETEIAELRARAETVKGLTGNYRLDAFATRLAIYSGSDNEIEGIAGLAANKPPRDWVDRDIDQARIEIAALAQEFIKAESLAHVKGRLDRRLAMALYFGDPNRPAPITPEFHITLDQRPQVDSLVFAFRAVLNESRSSRDVALAALAELGSQLAAPSPTGTSRDADQPLRRCRA
jgi:hypothetical protein